MGQPKFVHPHLPENPPEAPYQLAARDGQAFQGWLAHYGNPHFVTFVEQDPMATALTYGPELETNPHFPDRANISFVRVLDDTLEAVVFERGVGITQACGTGACAIGVAAIRAGYQNFRVLFRYSYRVAFLRLQLQHPMIRP